MPDDPLNHAEALRHIQSLVNAFRAQAQNTHLEVFFREVSAILDRALPKQERARKPRE